MVFGIKTNKCLQKGLQGICTTVEATASTSGDVYMKDGADNNSRFILKDYGSILIGMMPETPEPDYNFDITIQNTSGFYGTLAGVFVLSYASIESSGDNVTIKWDNPDFDVADNWSVIHVHFWFDGINYCGSIDGYV